LARLGFFACANSCQQEAIAALYKGGAISLTGKSACADGNRAVVARLDRYGIWLCQHNIKYATICGLFKRKRHREIPVTPNGKQVNLTANAGITGKK
jgi:hypothetical protein